MNPVRLLGLLVLAVAAAPALGAPAWDAPPAAQTQGQFWRLHWYERGLTNANPAYEARFRVNSPEVVLHPQFGRRVEARENGLMLIRAEEDLFQLTGAELYLEMWGGHPGTANKRVTVNGRGTYLLPRVGTEEGHCTYQYPSLPLRISDLVNGYDAFQFALDQGTTFWGHLLVDNACLRVALANRHPDVQALGLDGFSARVQPEPRASVEGFHLRLEGPSHWVARVAEVQYQGWYDGYDENGNRLGLDWHGFTKQRRPVAWLGSAARPPFTVEWDTSLLPAQGEVAVRALVRFQDVTNLVFLTPATSGLKIAERLGHAVALVTPGDLPPSFWSRAGQKKRCTLTLPVAPARIEGAELHVVTWTGGPGTVKDYFTLNGVPYPVAEGARHELVYSRLPVAPGSLRPGVNAIELLSDTEHHGIEVCLPGPALLIRYRTEGPAH